MQYLEDLPRCTTDCELESIFDRFVLGVRRLQLNFHIALSISRFLPRSGHLKRIFCEYAHIKYYKFEGEGREVAVEKS